MGEGYGMYSPGYSGWTSLRNEEFQEEDVWAVLNNRKHFTSEINSSESSTIALRKPSSASRMIPRANTTSINNQEPKIIQRSAPVNVPDWSKIYGKMNSSKKKADRGTPWLDDDDDDDKVDNDGDNNNYSEEEDDIDVHVMPPHEWIARKLARSQISCFSVCEGAGRTLKGRDLSRVRNAVLSKTGFLE
ncbi:hypothetical protein NMG60_11002210 [Bertholletia excelsa]